MLFYKELQEYGSKASETQDPALVDYEGTFREIIKDLFNIYEALIILSEEEQLLGLIGTTQILIKKSPRE